MAGAAGRSAPAASNGVTSAVDPAELPAREVLGPARLTELVSRYGKPLAVPVGEVSRTFRRAEALAEAGSGGVEIDSEADPGQLLGLPGVSERAAALIRMRTLRDPDAALPGVPIREVDRYRPWRSYASQHFSP
ncbi:hypothetical protein [Nonomuraea sp. NPDC048826]|uniref:hypothetical protein n=1 Tax=Nonomuraea sp. NPDC048826 TaxID=3364347 RepID=UPI0037107058